MTKKIGTPSIKQVQSSTKIHWTTRIIGIILFACSLSVFVQAVPLLFVFTGGFLGIPATISWTDMDVMIWLLTCITLMVLSIYAFLAWMKYVWQRFIRQAVPLTFFTRKEKSLHQTSA